MKGERIWILGQRGAAQRGLPFGPGERIETPRLRRPKRKKLVQGDPGRQDLAYKPEHRWIWTRQLQADEGDRPLPKTLAIRQN